MFINRLSSSFGQQVQRGKSHARSAGLLLVSIIALFALVAPQTALAATQPQISTYLDVGLNLIDCGSFTAQEDYSIPTRVIVFASDSDGNAIRGQAHQDYNATFTNLNTGYSLPGYGQKTILFDEQAVTKSNIGLFIRVSIPGGGVVTLHAGNLTFGPDDVTFSGNHHWADGPDLLCAALS